MLRNEKFAPGQLQIPIVRSWSISRYWALPLPASTRVRRWRPGRDRPGFSKRKSPQSVVAERAILPFPVQETAAAILSRSWKGFRERPKHTRHLKLDVQATTIGTGDGPAFRSYKNTRSLRTRTNRSRRPTIFWATLIALVQEPGEGWLVASSSSRSRLKTCKWYTEGLRKRNSRDAERRLRPKYTLWDKQEEEEIRFGIPKENSQNWVD